VLFTPATGSAAFKPDTVTKAKTAAVTETPASLSATIDATKRLSSGAPVLLSTQGTGSFAATPLAPVQSSPTTSTTTSSTTSTVAITATTAPATTTTTVPAPVIAPPSLTPGDLQASLLKKLIEDAQFEFRQQVHADVINLHVDVLRGFATLKAEMAEMLRQHLGSVQDLVKENERLREEVRRLKNLY
jgi:hypothetical protein